MNAKDYKRRAYESEMKLECLSLTSNECDLIGLKSRLNFVILKINFITKLDTNLQLVIACLWKIDDITL